jgi:hypothetical protein
MKRTTLTFPELGMIAGTRAALGAGAALLLADRFTREQRKTVGLTLFVIGAVSTVPLALLALGRLEKRR